MHFLDNELTKERKYMLTRVLLVAGMLVSLVVGDAMALADVKPPKVPHVSDVPENSDEALSRLPKQVEPPAFTKAIAELQRGNLKSRVERLKSKVLDELIAVEGGEFMMGDFGRLWNPSGLYFYGNKSETPVHKVVLSGFSINKYKVTFAEYDVFTDATKRKRVATNEYDADVFRYPTVPVMTTWADAQAYCRWLGQRLGRPMDLPTEAQWEYAARSQGQFFATATDDGNLDYGRNIGFDSMREYLKPEGREVFNGYSAAYFPPNPLGLHQMHLNGYEWVRDWYDESYYAKSPERDPEGPVTGVHKAVRGQPSTGAGEIGTTFARWYAPPDAKTSKRLRKRALPGLDPDGYGAEYQNTFRCSARR
jgi:sulfatase modifying factor 1